MIKAWHEPATEDLVEQALAKLSPGLATEPGFKAKLTQAIDVLKGLDYRISIEVEVHGDMAKALESLGGDASNYVKMERPKRRT